MELVIDNVENLNEIILKGSDGTTYCFVKSYEYKEILKELNDLRRNSDDDFVMQSKYMKEKRIGKDKLDDWVSKGLPKYVVGGNVYYRRSEIAEFKAKHRV